MDSLEEGTTTTSPETRGKNISMFTLMGGEGEGPHVAEARGSPFLREEGNLIKSTTGGIRHRTELQKDRDDRTSSEEHREKVPRLVREARLERRRKLGLGYLPILKKVTDSTLGKRMW